MTSSTRRGGQALFQARRADAGTLDPLAPGPADRAWEATKTVAFVMDAASATVHGLLGENGTPTIRAGLSEQRTAPARKNCGAVARFTLIEQVRAIFGDQGARRARL